MSVVDSIFIDTNLLVYANDRSELVKAPKAQALLSQMLAIGWPTVSVQILSEFYWTVTRKIPLPLTHDEASAQLAGFISLMRIVPLTLRLFEKAMQLLGTYALALWDAQILAAAVLNGNSRVLSEDFQHRRTIEGVTFLNPFAPDFDPAEILVP